MLESERIEIEIILVVNLKLLFNLVLGSDMAHYSSWGLSREVTLCVLHALLMWIESDSYIQSIWKRRPF